MRPLIFVIYLFCGILAVTSLTSLTSCRSLQNSDSVASRTFDDLGGALVVIECSSGDVTTFRPSAAATRFPPCSTFKIVNALIGLEAGIISSPDKQFYKWDGIKRSIPAWNRDLSLREAFQVSCVPAFQDLARQIGQERMQGYLENTGYGNLDISAGIDVFWLPSKGRNTILISPTEQAELMRRIVSGEVPFSKTSLAVLKKLMFIKKTDQGALYGKTGSATDDHGTFVLGWFVGYAVSKGKTYAFACTTQGENTMSRDAQKIVEKVLESRGIL